MELCATGDKTMDEVLATQTILVSRTNSLSVLAFLWDVMTKVLNLGSSVLYLTLAK